MHKMETIIIEPNIITNAKTQTINIVIQNDIISDIINV